MPAALAALCLLLAFVQRPGEDVADTKVHLYLDPAGFLRDVLSAWSPTGDLGHVWGGQYGGYLFPMGPWFAGGDALGVPSWVMHRLWLAALLFAAAWGVVKLLQELWRPRLELGHASAAVLYVLNPYVTVYANRTSVALLAYAALPWLLLAVHRGLRDPRGWRWPAVFALVLTCAGGGVNAAVTGWALLAPLLLVLYEVWTRRAPLSPWLWRMAVVNVAASAWWVVPVLVHGRYGLDFLPFTEQPGTIWGTTSLPESLRLMGFWTSYIGVGFRPSLVPFASHGAALLFDLPLVLAGLLVPAIVLAAAARWSLPERYGPFFFVLVLVGLVVMVAGWPEGTPLRRALTFTYNHVEATQFLRTTYKAAPLVALGIACLAAPVPRQWLLAPLVLLAAWPLVAGRALDGQLRFDVPQDYRDAARRLDARGDATRALLVPGQLFAAHTWGETIDPVLPALAHDRPVATRNIVPYADLRSVDLQWAVDALLTQRRTVPEQLPGLLDLMGVGDVVLATDMDAGRGGNIDAGSVARQLGVRVPHGRLGVTPVPTGGIVRVLPRAPMTVVDGGAGALTGLAAFGGLQPDRPIAHAADVDGAEIRRAGRVVISDTNRRQAFVAARPRGNVGRVLPPDEDVSEDGVVLDPWQRADAETVQVLRGVRALRAPYSPQMRQFPEHRPFAAVDGDERTMWLADRALAADRRWLQVDFDRPRDVAAVDLLAYGDARGRVTAVELGGRRFVVRRGWNHLRLGLRAVRSLRVRIAATTRPRKASAGAGGLRELRIPGLRVDELLRPPVVAEHALRGTSLDRTTLTYLFARFTADDPFLRGRLSGTVQAGEPRDAQDAEREVARTFAPPVPRRWTATAWVHADPHGGDAALDRLAGTRGDLIVSSSSRYHGRPRNRGSGAFDGTTSRGWLGQWIPGEPAWLQWRTRSARTVRRLQLVPSAHGARPARVRLVVDGRTATGAVDVAPDGLVALARPVRGRTFKLHVLAVHGRGHRAVGIAEVHAAGLRRLRVPRRGTLEAPCGSAAIRVGPPGGATPLPLRVSADLGAFDAGRPLRADGCRAVRLPATTVDVRGVAAPLVVDRLRLDGAPPGGLSVVPAAGGRVLDAGDGRNGERTGVRVAADGPAWLVLGESTNRGWRATCDGRDLGAPRTLQGYANAWPLDPPGCRDVRFAWVPNRAVRASLAVSAVGCLVLLALALVPLRRRRPLPGPDRTPLRLAPAHPVPARRALAIGVAAGVAIGFVFAMRAGLVLGPLVALVLWRGTRTAPLAGVLLVVAVPFAYALTGPTDRGGYAAAYATQHIAAHWLAVAAWVLLAVSVARGLSAARRGSGP